LFRPPFFYLLCLFHLLFFYLQEASFAASICLYAPLSGMAAGNKKIPDRSKTKIKAGIKLLPKLFLRPPLCLSCKNQLVIRDTV